MSYHLPTQQSDSESLPVTLSNLPNDIICEIIHIIFATGRQMIKPRMIRGDYNKNMISATHVCRSWRKAAIHSPLLWNHLVIPLFSHDQILEYLARSNSAPLILYVIESDESETNNLQVLDMHLHRIREWYLCIRPGSILNPNLSSYFNKLKGLEYLWLYTNIRYARESSNLLHTSIFPSNLRRLSMNGFIFSSDRVLAPFENLTHFALRDTTVSLNTLHEFFSLGNNLEHLHFALVTLSPSSSSPHSTTVSSKIRLPKLHDFILESSANGRFVNLDILDHFILPSLATMTFVWVDIIPKSYTHSLASTRAYLPTIKAYDSLEVSVAPQRLAVEGIARDDTTNGREHRTKVVWRMLPNRVGISRGSSFLENFLKDVTSTANKMFYAVKVLKLSFTGVETGVPSAEGLKSLLNSMSTVETYIFHSNGDTMTYRNLRFAIAEALASSDMFVDQSTIHTSQLRCIQLDGFYFGQQERGYVVLGALMEAFSRRQELGCVLPELHLKQAHGMTSAVLDGLRSVVGTVRWDEEHENF